MTKKIVDIRREEIINVCEELYEKESFKEITIKSIGERTSFSRTSIYNYFQTKEEIFLALFQSEYEKWTDDLNRVYEENDNLSKNDFASKLAQTIEKRPTLLKLLSMNLYDMEENSRMELLVDFKGAYKNSVETVKKCLDKFFTFMTEKEKNSFMSLFFPFVYGIYPYTFATDKQKEAMKKAGISTEHLSIYEIAYQGILKLL